ncbi:MAG: 50S ribosomal protein L29 [Candidatus Stahlbacteria bacterium]|nr:50S ribosomal protein L29 [Candidatus Stahlbacteria bacterium]
MKPSELRELSIPEVETEIHRLSEELFSIKFKHKAQPVANPLKIRTLRREIARAITIKLEKEHKAKKQAKQEVKSQEVKPKTEEIKIKKEKVELKAEPKLEKEHKLEKKEKRAKLVKKEKEVKQTETK